MSDSDMPCQHLKVSGVAHPAKTTWFCDDCEVQFFPAMTWSDAHRAVGVAKAELGENADALKLLDRALELLW